MMVCAVAIAAPSGKAPVGVSTFFFFKEFTSD
jgi:hypothetical protein